MTPKIQKTDAEWKALLKEKGAESVAFDVTRHAGTERAFSGKYETVWADGAYHCMCCGEKLGQPQPASNLVAESNSFSPQHMQW